MNISPFDSNANCNTCQCRGFWQAVLINDIMTAYISSGAKCWVIDIGRSYEKPYHTMDDKLL